MRNNDNFREHAKHELIEIDLMDAYYGERELTNRLRNHISNCSQCASFWNELNAIGDKLSGVELHEEIEIDERIIRRAFSEADKIMLRKKELGDFRVFLIIASFLIFAIGWLAYSGYATQIIYLQLVFVVLAPLSIPVLIWKRLAKEGK